MHWAVMHGSLLTRGGCCLHLLLSWRLWHPVMKAQQPVAYECLKPAGYSDE
jgi:hypothetical protein